MKKVLLITLCSFLLLTPHDHADAQFSPDYACHLDEVNIASVFATDNKIDSAIAHYKKAMNCFAENGKAWVDFASLYEKKKDYKSAVNAYGMAVLKGYFPCLGQDTTDFPNWGSNIHILPFVEKLDSLKATFYSQSYNREFTELTNRLAGVDMFVRRASMFDVAHDSLYNGAIKQIFSYADTGYNLPRLLDYLDTHPFPPESTLDGACDFWLLVHHILQYEDSNPQVAKLRTYVLDAVYQGKYNLTSYIRTLDYYYSIHHSKQLYGTYKNEAKDGNYIYSSGIDSIQTVDLRRAKWHLLPLYLEVKTNDLHPLLPEGYSRNTQEK